MFSQNNNTFYLLPSGVKTLENLPGGIYHLKCDTTGTLFLSKTNDEYILPEKLYGNTLDRSDRIINSYTDRKDKNTGVGLIGTQGSGKSLLAKKIAMDTLKLKNEFGDGIVIIVSEDYTEHDMDIILQSIKQPCNVFLDEFEKVFKEESQERMLTILDGNLVKNILFTITVNNIFKVNQHMINRPGRLFYNIQYRGLDKEFIEEYCKDKLTRINLVPNIHKTSMLVEEFNFDMLQAIVEELNRYPNSSYKECVEILNIVPSSYKKRFSTEYQMKLIKIGDEDVSEKYEEITVSNPLSENNYVGIDIKDEFKDDDGGDDDQNNNHYYFYTQELDIVETNDDGTEIKFYNPEYDLLILAKRKDKKPEFKDTLFF